MTINPIFSNQVRLLVAALPQVFKENSSCHSFAMTALSLGENPLWISNVMGHRDTDMILRAYAKFVRNAANHNDGKALNNLHAQLMSNCQ